MVKLVVENGKPEVDDDGFVALVDIAYVGYVDEDWTLPQLLEQFARERRAEHAVIAYPGPDLSGSPLELRPAPTGRVTRSFQSALTVTGERVWLSAYSQLTMAAQFEDEPPMVSYTPWIAIPNGRYLVSVQQARTTFRKAVRVHIALEPIDPDSDEFTTGAALVPWFDDSGSLDAD